MGTRKVLLNRCSRLLAALLMVCASLAAQSVDASAVVGEVRVADVAEFSTGSYTLSVQVPDDVVWQFDRRPFVDMQRFVDGAWKGVAAPPGSRWGMGPSEGSQFERPVWRSPEMAAGQRFDYTVELRDWRVVGYPGEYRMRVRWVVSGEMEFRWTAWRTFSVVAGDCEVLQAARQANDQTWQHYVEFLMTPLRFGQLAEMLLRPEGNTVGAELRQVLLKDLNAHQVAVAGLTGLPKGLQTRLRIMHLLEQYGQVFTTPAGAERQQLLVALAADARAAVLFDGIYGEAARCYEVACNRLAEVESWKEEAARAWQRPTCRAFALSQPALVELLHPAELPGPGRRLPGAGPWLPR